MKKTAVIFSILTGLAIILTTAGCQTEQPELTESEIAKAARIKAESREIGEKLLTAFIDGKASAFVELLPLDARKQFGAKEFNDTRNTLGETIGTAEKFEFLTRLDAPVFSSYLWKVTFRRRDMLAQEKEITQETLFRIITGELDGKPYIISFGFL